MDIRFDGKTALITGAGRGIGRGIALGFARSGADIVIADVNEENAQRTCKEIEALGRKAKYVVTDVRDVDQVQRMVDACDRLDIFIHAAGVLVTKYMLEATQEEIKRLFDINILGSSNVIRAVLPRMQAQRSGKIVLIASIAGREGGDLEAHYRMSKSAVISLTMSTADAGAAYNINCNAICPGHVRTEMWDQALDDWAAKPGRRSQEEIWDWMVETMIPLKRPQTPDDMANAAMFLCSDEAWNITGQTLSVCGGYYMGF